MLVSLEFRFEGSVQGGKKKMTPVKRVALIDIFHRYGHHNGVYIHTLKTMSVGVPVKIDNYSVKCMPSRLSLSKYLLNLFVDSRDCHLHFAYVDPLVGTMLGLLPALLVLKKINRIVITGTYHNLEKNPHMNRLCTLFDGVVVHTAGAAFQLNCDTTIITYPSFLQPTWCRDFRYGTRPPRLGFLGGNRSDKRMDLFLDAVNSMQEDVEVILAGTNCDPSVIGRTLLKKGVVHSRFLTENELRRMFEYIDVLVLPYDNSFVGISGLISEAACAGKVIISSEASFNCEVVAEMNLGPIFRSGNVEALQRSILEAIRNYDAYNRADRTSVYAEFSSEAFVQRYSNFITSTW